MSELRTVTRVGGVDTTDRVVVPLLVSGLDWKQSLNRTVTRVSGDPFSQFQLGTPGQPTAVLSIILSSYADVVKLASMYASALPMIYTEASLGLTWRHYATDELSWSVMPRAGRAPWWSFTVAAAQVKAA